MVGTASQRCSSERRLSLPAVSYAEYLSCIGFLLPSSWFQKVQGFKLIVLGSSCSIFPRLFALIQSLRSFLSYGRLALSNGPLDRAFCTSL